MVPIITIRFGLKQFGSVQNNLVQFKMQTVRFGSVILNLSNNSVWFGSFSSRTKSCPLLNFTVVIDLLEMSNTQLLRILVV